MTTSAPHFSGFPAETLQFLTDLQTNNNREWFAANKAVYERAIKQPAADFAAAMCAQLATLTGNQHRSKIFRIYRDVRFSKDKTPYNSYLHLSFTPDNGMSMPPGWFFGLDPDHFTLGAGIFAFDKAQLDTYRQAVSGEQGEKLQKQLAKLEKHGIRMREKPELKRTPPGYSAEHPQAHLLRRKGLTVWQDFAPEIVTGDVVAHCLRSFKTLQPITQWLEQCTR